MEPDPSTINPFEAANALVFLGGPTFDPNEPSAVFGMITGVKTWLPGVDQAIEIRRVLLRAPRMEEQLREYEKSRRRSSMNPEAFGFGVGLAFRDKAGWALGYYFEECDVLRTYEDMSGALPIVEDVLVVAYNRKAEITEQLQSKIVMAR